MACGAPVVATNEGGLPDFVTEDVGRLVDVEDAEGLANMVTKILKGEIAFDRSAISDKMRRLYSQDALMSEFINSYNEAIQQSKNHRNSSAGLEIGD